VPWKRSATGSCGSRRAAPASTIRAHAARDNAGAVSEENVDVVRSSLLAFASEGLDAMSEFWAQDISWRAIEGAPDDAGEMTGRDAARRYCQDWMDTFDGIQAVPEELQDLGGDGVLAVFHLAGRARLSGVETELRYAVVYRLRDGKIARVREYAERGQAAFARGD
jgi:ketosteroid isomerase-like protein